VYKMIKVNIDRDKKVFKNFAMLPYVAKINIFESAFGIGRDKAKIIYTKIFSEMERQNRILKYAQIQKKYHTTRGRRI